MDEFALGGLGIQPQLCFRQWVNHDGPLPVLCLHVPLRETAAEKPSAC